MAKYAFATFDPDGLPTGFWQSAAYPDTPEGDRPAGVPEHAIPLLKSQYEAFQADPGLRCWVNGHVVAYTPPEPAAPVQRISKNAIWERATDAEAVAMKHALSAQSVRVQEIYSGATHINTDHELFTLLNGALTGLFGAPRAAQLLAPTD